MSDKSELT